LRELIIFRHPVCDYFQIVLLIGAIKTTYVWLYWIATYGAKLKVLVLHIEILGRNSAALS
jgi:hypothetical protein